MPRNPAPTEVDCYIYIKEELKKSGWDTRNPELFSPGQVVTQNECLSNPEIKKLLGLDKPENIVKIDESSLWVIEAKSKQSMLNQAVSEAKQYAKKINKSKRLQTKFITAVASNNHESFIVKTYFFHQEKYSLVKLNDVEATGFLSPEQTEYRDLTIIGTKNGAKKNHIHL